jgi:hypothetical protein
MANRSTKDKEMAADLKRRGIYHGRRLTKGLDATPKFSDVGSAAYRRLVEKKRQGAAK